MLTKSVWQPKWKKWNAFAKLAGKYLGAAVSEAEVERSLSIQKHILGAKMTQISTETIEARIILHGKRAVGGVQTYDMRKNRLDELVYRCFGDVLSG